MSITFSLVVPIADDGEDVAGLVRSVDDQSLPYADFEVVFVDRGSSEDSVARLDVLARHRPNILVLHADDAAQPASLGEVLSRLSGEYVMFLAPTDLLLPEALERLHAFATSSDADVVLGRAGDDHIGANAAALFADQRRRATESLAYPLRCVAYRRQLLVEGSASGDIGLPVTEPASQKALVESARNVAVLAHYPVLKASSSTPRRGQLDVRTESARWDGGVLELSLAATPSWDDGDTAPAVSAHLVLRGPAGLEYIVPATLDAANGAAASSAAIAVRIDVREAALGELLPDGVWILELRMLGSNGHGFARLTAVDDVVALVDGRPVVLHAGSNGLELQVGRVSQNLVQADPDDAVIVETVRGTSLELPLRHITVSGAGSLEGMIRLGSIGFRATIAVEDGAASLRCFLSGLPGSYPIACQLGSSAFLPTGLELEVSPVGAMKLVRLKPAPKPAAVPKQKPVKRSSTQPKAATKKAAAKRTPPSPIARLRRRVPDPVVGRLAQIPGVKAAYRSLARR